ncbi:hypothetical protein ACW5R3_04145 [Bizionia sp. KMM 8389]
MINLTNKIFDEASELSRQLSEVTFELRRLKLKLDFIKSNKKWKFKEGDYTKKVSSEMDNEQFKTKNVEIYPLISHQKNKRVLNILLKQIVDKINILSENNNLYWRNCSLETYKQGLSTFQELFKQALPDSNITDFLEYELNFYSNNLREHKFYLSQELTWFTGDFKDYLSSKDKTKADINDKIKVKFLNGYANELGYDIVSDGDSILKTTVSLSKQNNELKEVPDISLDKKGLPKFNLQTRFELFKQLGGDIIIKNIISPTEKGKALILGTIMDINPDNSRHLINKTYKPLKEKDESNLTEFFQKQDITIKKQD